MTSGMRIKKRGEISGVRPRAVLHENVQDRPSAKCAPVGCPLATMALKTAMPLYQKVGCTAEVVTQSGCHCIRAELNETGGPFATLAVNRLGHCRATRPR